MGYGRILYYERYDGFGVLVYPTDSFNLAVTWSGKSLFVRPIIELAFGEWYFLYQGKKVNPFSFDLRPDESEPDWALDWIEFVARTGKIDIDFTNLTDEYRADFDAMLTRKQEKLKKWLSAK